MCRTYDGLSFEALFPKIVSDINVRPQYQTSPRDQLCREVISSVITLRNPRDRVLANQARKADYGFGVGEFFWYWKGMNDLGSMLYYNKRMDRFSDDGLTLNSAYGYRTRVEDISTNWGQFNQWEACKEELLEDNDSRRAILMIARAEDFVSAVHRPGGSKDVPCTLNLQFFIRGGKLHLHVNMRSNDAFWGLTYDLFSFTLLQEAMMLELNEMGMHLTLGEYTHCAGSLHIYERHFQDADAVVKTYLSKEFHKAEPMEPFSLKELALLAEQEEALRTGKVAEIGEAQFSGGARWMAQRLNEHRRKRDAERG